ncbi:MarP family serine protease [Aeromicrobium alkaliterrae]|uniref:MarP family serine protease n=1 Tax=Aeromicrobium alkaliterrae TaxID=302168 RepID=A0ABN2K3I2_9ACTN
MNSLDLCIVLVALAFAVSGVVQGFLANLAATLGLLAGGLLAVLIVPLVISPDEPSLASSLTALGIVVAVAAGGQIMGTVVGTDLRRTVRTPTGRWFDAAGGGVLSVVSVLVVSWALGYAVSGTTVPYLSTAARDSTILGAVDDAMPSQAAGVLHAFSDVIDANLFPRYLDPFDSEDIVRVGPPDPATLLLPGVEQASASVVKILGEASCDRGIEGTGFVYAENRVMTNAHVVAGVSRPSVVTTEGSFDAEVVVFDPTLDVAVLAVDLDLPALAFDTAGRAGQDAAVLGYPGNGPFDAQAARIREQIRLKSPDIYNDGQHVRESFSIRSLVRSGNSGGPLVSADGQVLGVIFAASVTDSNTGYALTASQVADAAEQGRTSTREVGTGGCA